MVRRLNTNVFVNGSWYGPTSSLSDEVSGLITNPDVWAEGGPSVPESEPKAAEVKEPPRGGPGSSADAWRAFMVSRNFDVPEGASAKDMQAAWDNRDKG